MYSRQFRLFSSTGSVQRNRLSVGTIWSRVSLSKHVLQNGNVSDIHHAPISYCSDNERKRTHTYHRTQSLRDQFNCRNMQDLKAFTRNSALSIFALRTHYNSAKHNYCITNIKPNWYQISHFRSLSSKKSFKLDKQVDIEYTKARKQQMRAILTQMQSVPNIITTTRILSTPIICFLIYTQDFHYATICCTAAAFSDWLDGYIAREYDGKTVLGTYLDPLADKILINSLSISLTSVGILPLWSTALWFSRDFLLIGSAYYMAKKAAEKIHTSTSPKQESRPFHGVVADPSRTPLQVEPTMSSRFNTLMQFVTIMLGLGSGMDFISGDLVSYSCYITAGMTITSGFSYVGGQSMAIIKNKK